MKYALVIKHTLCAENNSAQPGQEQQTEGGTWLKCLSGGTSCRRWRRQPVKGTTAKIKGKIENIMKVTQSATCHSSPKCGQYC